MRFSHSGLRGWVCCGGMRARHLQCGRLYQGYRVAKNDESKSNTLQASTRKNEMLRESQDFSLVLGGPLFQLLRRSHLTGDALELARQRIIVISLFAWLPLLALSALKNLFGILF